MGSSRDINIVKYKTVRADYEEFTDSILAVTGQSNKCEKEGVRNLFLTKKLIELDAVADCIKLHPS